MRKFVLASLVMFLAVGLTVGAPALVVKLDGDKLTVKEGKKGEEVEKEYKITDKTEFVDGEDKAVEAAKGKEMLGKMAEKGKSRVDLTGEDGKVTKIKFGKKKKTN